MKTNGELTLGRVRERELEDAIRVLVFACEYDLCVDWKESLQTVGDAGCLDAIRVIDRVLQR